LKRTIGRVKGTARKRAKSQPGIKRSTGEEKAFWELSGVCGLLGMRKEVGRPRRKPNITG